MHVKSKVPRGTGADVPAPRQVAPSARREDQT